MDLTEIDVEVKTISVSIVRTTVKDVVIDDDDVAEEDRHKRVEVKLANPYLHVNCILFSVSSNQFVAGCDYVDDNRMVYHATNCDTIVLVTPKLDQYIPPKKVIMFNRPYKEGNHA